MDQIKYSAIFFSISYIILFILVIVLVRCILSHNNNHVNEKFYNYNLDLANIYGHKCPSNRNKSYFDILLKEWNLISKTYKIHYSLSYGTLLGQVRHGDYIPYDNDIDIHIGKESISRLINLKNKPWCCFNNEIATYPLEIGKIRLILNKWHNNPFYQRKRYNCNGQAVNSHDDSCSFNGIMARLILKISNNKYKNLDIFVYNYITCSKTQQKLIKENNSLYFKNFL